MEKAKDEKRQEEEDKVKMQELQAKHERDLKQREQEASLEVTKVVKHEIDTESDMEEDLQKMVSTVKNCFNLDNETRTGLDVHEL